MRTLPENQTQEELQEGAPAVDETTPVQDIYSHSRRPRSKKRLVANICISFFSVLFILAGCASLWANAVLSGYQYVPDEEDQGQVSKVPIGNVNQTEEELGDAYMVDGLYHDDMVTNILLLGVDDYGSETVGRADSMLMVSLDRRHKKLKLTSFMRDTYVSIPGYNYYKLNTGYYLGALESINNGGSGNGAPLLVKTIEKNFGCDIDRYVIVDYAAFPHIIDALGGIEVELSAAEADEMNRKSGETGATEGLNQLSGAQARYYSRIRYCKYTDQETGEVYYDDYGRIRRQQHVIDTLIENFKDADAGQILSLANQIVPYLISNISPDEMLTLATDALTYMGYPMETCQIPNNELHIAQRITDHSGVQDVLLLQTMDGRNTQEDTKLFLNRFIYEDSFPELAAFKLPSEEEDSASSDDTGTTSTSVE